MKCKDCNTETKCGEGWIEFNEEKRHAFWYFCPTCKSVYSILGEKILNAKGELQLTFPKN